MLVIRMQRTGRKGHAQFRVVVQDSRRTPTSGKIVALIGNYNPHAKTATINKEKAEQYLKNGAQPSERVARLFKAEGIKLPDWVVLASDKKRSIRNTEKLRRNRPAEPEAEAAPVEEAEATESEATDTDEAPVDAPADEVAETPEEEKPAE